MTPKDRGIVYSSDHGRTCPDCGQAQAKCTCRGSNRNPAKSGSTSRAVRVEKTSKGRKGKTVSVITGLDLNIFEITELARELKQRCGTGGTVKDDVIEIQGDHVDTLVAELCKRGFAAKRSGG